MVLFADRSFEPEELAPYQPLLDAGLLRRYYLDEMPEVAGAPLGLSILSLIGQTQSQAPETARVLVARCKKEIEDEKLRDDLLQLVNTVIFYKFPLLSRKEIEAMLQVDDLRQTRVYQEAKEEGLKEGIEKGIEKGIEAERQRSIAKMAALKMPADAIADLLGLDVDLVRKEMAKNPS